MLSTCIIVHNNMGMYALVKLIFNSDGSNMMIPTMAEEFYLTTISQLFLSIILTNYCASQ